MSEKRSLKISKIFCLKILNFKLTGLDFLKFSFFKQFFPNFHKKMIYDMVKNLWVSWNHASYTPILVKNDNYTKSNFMHK